MVVVNRHLDTGAIACPGVKNINTPSSFERVQLQCFFSSPKSIDCLALRILCQASDISYDGGVFIQRLSGQPGPVWGARPGQRAFFLITQFPSSIPHRPLSSRISSLRILSCTIIVRKTLSLFQRTPFHPSSIILIASIMTPSSRLQLSAKMPLLAQQEISLDMRRLL
jgi:hypothetical protein